MSIYHGYKTRDNNFVETEVETTSVKPTPKEVKDLQALNHGDYNNENIRDEFNKNVDSDKKLNNIKDFDGNKETNSLQDMNRIEDMKYTEDPEVKIALYKQLDQFTQFIRKDKCVKDEFSENDVKNMIINYCSRFKIDIKKERSVQEAKQILSIIKLTIQEDAQNMSRLRNMRK